MDEKIIEDTFECKMKQCEIECTVPYGGVLLFSNAIVHCSYTNLSKDIRWSIDLRWQVRGIRTRIVNLLRKNYLTIINFKDPRKPNGRPESNDVMPIFKKDGKMIQDIDWSVLIDRHKVS